VFLYSIQTLEQCSDGFLVSFLSGGEAGFVDAVVNIVVGPFVCGFDFLLQADGEEFDVAVLGLDYIIKL
jgi:hypothetical protein